MHGLCEMEEEKSQIFPLPFHTIHASRDLSNIKYDTYERIAKDLDLPFPQ